MLRWQQGRVRAEEGGQGADEGGVRRGWGRREKEGRRRR
jgi:hypothetical protein